jgi:hypothetical protein
MSRDIADDNATLSMQAAATSLRDLADLIEDTNGQISPTVAWTIYRALNQVAGNLDAASAVHDMRRRIRPYLRQLSSRLPT